MTHPQSSTATAFEECIRRGGVALFPSDTVYGLACDPSSEAVVRRLYEIKDRPPAKASAVMFFDLHAALGALGGAGGAGAGASGAGGAGATPLGERTRTALHSLMPGGVTVLLENPARLWPLACAADSATIGVRVIDVPALRGVSVPVLQSSANLSGGAEARRLEDVAEPIRAAVDLEIDGGELPGVASTVIDLRRYERDGVGAVAVLRQGAVSEADVVAALERAETYGERARHLVPEYDRLQDAVAEASGDGARRILELGVGTGETTRRLLARHPEAVLVGLDESDAMLARAQAALSSERVEWRVGRLQDPLPRGPFDVVASALALHHLSLPERLPLIERVRDVVAPGGCFVLGEIVAPESRAAAGHEKVSVEEHLGWLRAAGLEPRVHWAQGEVAVIVGERPRR